MAAVTGLAGLTALAMVTIYWHREPPRPSASPLAAAAAGQLVSAVVPPATNQVLPAAVRASGVARFAAVRETADYRWMAQDAKDTNVIRLLARNELEYQRLVEENDRIIRRQLVYCKDTADAQIERAKLTGTRVRQLVLPGLDGQELTFEITTSELNPSGQQGAFAGKLAGRPDSMVTFAFKGRREAFTIISPADNLYYQTDPYEPGAVLVKSINPDTYVPGLCGTPD